MSTYKITLTTEASAQVAVEAETFEEAIEAAYAKGLPFLCAQCSGGPLVLQEDSLELGENWEPVESSYVKDGEYVEVED